MLFDYYETDRLIVCMDPANLDLLNDFAADRSVTRMLEIECQLTDDYLTGHAMRSGLAGDQTSQETLTRLLPTIRADMQHDSDLLRDAKITHYDCLRELGHADRNAAALSRSLSLSGDTDRARGRAAVPVVWIRLARAYDEVLAPHDITTA